VDERFRQLLPPECLLRQQGALLKERAQNRTGGTEAGVSCAFAIGRRHCLANSGLSYERIVGLNGELSETYCFGLAALVMETTERIIAEQNGQTPAS